MQIIVTIKMEVVPEIPEEPRKEETLLDALRRIDKMAGGVDNWPEWKKNSHNMMRFGESFERG